MDGTKQTVFGGFTFYKAISHPDVGYLELWKSEKSEYLIKKTLNDRFSQHSYQIQDRVRDLKSSGFQRLVAVSNEGESVCLYLEFSRKNLGDHLVICQERDQWVAEEDLMSLLVMLADCGDCLECKGEYHPSLTLQNIFRVKDSFKLVNPFIFDSYIHETLQALNPVSKPTSSLTKKDKIKLNIAQCGLVVLAMSILQTEDVIRREIKNSNLDSLMKTLSEKYSSEFTTLISGLLGGEVQSFASLKKKLTSKVDWISPPINFEQEVFQRSKEKAPKVNSEAEDGQNARYQRRFLGADSISNPIPRNKPLPDKPLSQAPASKNLEIADAFDSNQGIANIKQEGALISKNPRVGARRSFNESNASSYLTRKPLITEEPPKNRHQKEVENKHENPISFKSKFMTDYKNSNLATKVDDYSMKPRHSELEPRRNAILAQSKSLKDIEFRGNKVTDTEKEYTRSNQQFYPSNKDDKVASIYSRLNDRFKQYAAPTYGEKTDSEPEAKNKFLSHNRVLVRPVAKNTQPEVNMKPSQNIEDLSQNRNAGHSMSSEAFYKPERFSRYPQMDNLVNDKHSHSPDRGRVERDNNGYSPFELSVTKKKIREDRENHYNSLYMSSQQHDGQNYPDGFEESGQKKNRSVSFNLGRSVADQPRVASRTPKSILKNSVPEDERRWVPHTRLYTESAHQDRHRNTETDNFFIQPKRMAPLAESSGSEGFSRNQLRYSTSYSKPMGGSEGNNLYSTTPTKPADDQGSYARTSPFSGRKLHYTVGYY